jgi:surface polysaccharide O-acyltransferase-like enzyme
MPRNKSLDLLKFISIVFVAVIHFPFPGRFGFYMDAASRFAVPVFFMLTGYFVVQGGGGVIKSQIFKLLKYYFSFELLYALYYFLWAVYSNDLQNYQELFIHNLKHILMDPSFGFQLWYLINIIWALLIAMIFQRFKKLNLLFAISFFLHLAGIFLSRFSPSVFNYTPEIYMLRNFLVYGLFYLLLGWRIKNLDISRIKLNKYWLLAFAVVLCLMQGAERKFWQMIVDTDYRDYYITTIPAAAAVLIFTLKCNVKSRLAVKISTYSMPIYFLHVLFMEIFYTGLFGTRLWELGHSIPGSAVFIIMICVLSCASYEAAVFIRRRIKRRKIETVARS